MKKSKGMNFLRKLRAYPMTLWGVFFAVLLFGPAVLNLIFATPLRQDLKIGTYEVLEIQQNPPHLLLKDASGSTISANFPDDLAHRSPRQYLVLPSQFQEFKGCNAEVGYVAIHYLWVNENRVWSLGCSTGGRVDFDQTLRYVDRMDIPWWTFLRLSAAIFVIAFTFYFERRKKSGDASSPKGRDSSGI